MVFWFLGDVDIDLLLVVFLVFVVEEMCVFELGVFVNEIFICNLEDRIRVKFVFEFLLSFGSLFFGFIVLGIFLDFFLNFVLWIVKFDKLLIRVESFCIYDYISMVFGDVVVMVVIMF